MLDLRSTPDFSAPPPLNLSARTESARGAALRPLIDALREVHLAEEAVNTICSLIAVRAAHLVGDKHRQPADALKAAIQRLDSARDHLNSERLRVTNADEHSHNGVLDASCWGDVENGLHWSLEAALDDDSGDYTESNRLVASDVVSPGRAA